MRGDIKNKFRLLPGKSIRPLLYGELGRQESRRMESPLLLHHEVEQPNDATAQAAAVDDHIHKAMLQ